MSHAYSTKSRAGRRTVGLPDPLIKILRQHQEAQERERIEAGADWERKEYVFASPTGGPLSPNADFHVWKRLLRDAGVWDGHLRDARHTAATVLLVLGVPDVVIDSIAGWEPGGSGPDARPAHARHRADAPESHRASRGSLPGSTSG